MVSDEFQYMLSFSWNCDEMVESADSQGATRPSYFGPESQKFNSSGLAACAGFREAPASSAPSAAAKPSFGLILFWSFGARMDSPREWPRMSGRCREAGAGSSAAWQHLWDKFLLSRIPVLFLAQEAP